MRWLLATLIFAFALPVAAFASSDRFWTMWLIEPARISDEVLVLDKGDVIQETRFIPTALIEIREPLILPESGVLLAETGSQFFGLLGRHHTVPEAVTYPTYCSMNSRPSTAWLKVGRPGNDTRVCVVDEDGDGTLDYTFFEGSCPVAWPMVKGKLRLERATPLNDLPYENLSPLEIRATTKIELRFDGFGRRGDQPKVEVVLIDPEGLERTWSNKVEEVSQANQWEAFGAVFTIVGREGDAAVIRNDLPIQARPMIMGTNQDSC